MNIKTPSPGESRTFLYDIKSLEQVFVIRAMQAQPEEETFNPQAIEELNGLMELSETLWTKIINVTSPEITNLFHAYTGIERVIEWAQGRRWDTDLTPEIAMREAKKLLDEGLAFLD